MKKLEPLAFVTSRKLERREGNTEDKMFWRHIDDIIALVIIGGCFSLIAFGHDGQAWALLGVAASWVFRSGLEAKK